MSKIDSRLLLAGLGGAVLAGLVARPIVAVQAGPQVTLTSSELRPMGSGASPQSLVVDGLFFETAQGRVALPASLTGPSLTVGATPVRRATTMADGRTVSVTITPDGAGFALALQATPADDITGWGLSVDAAAGEYFTGLMERVVDGPQQASWAPGRTEAMDLRGQAVDMLVKPTLSIYAPFYLSSRGYGVFVRGTWPGHFDFAKTDPSRVAIAFDGPSLALQIYTNRDPAAIVRAHALDAGPPFLPPAWVYQPWRWRDEHTQRTAYYDGTPVKGPFNAEVMEDVLMMQAFGVPNGVYWIDRPWGLGERWGYDDFEIDPARLPHFADMVRWLESRGTRTALWIAPALQGHMADEAMAKHYVYPGQVRPPNGNNYPLADLTNAQARRYWQDGIAKLLRQGVAGFKLDRGEENIPDDGPFTLADGRSVREGRNPYISMAAKAAHDVAAAYRGRDFFVMPRAAYTGTSPYAIFWGGDIGGTQEGLRASIVAVQRAAVMGYPNWGSDTCGYNQQLMEQEVCARWLAFSAFTPIMEVGPTRNAGFWNLPRDPSYDEVLIATWRMYARIHARLADYSLRAATEATRSGMPIVRPLFLVDPEAPAAWTNWWTYQYGPDVVVSPIWQKGQRSQEVYLPSGARWRSAWSPGTEYDGGRTVTVDAGVHQLPIFIRAGSTVDLGDLNALWRESQQVASRRPDLAALEADVTSWFEQNASPAAAQ